MVEDAGFGRFPPETVSVAKAMANPHRMRILAHLEEEASARFTDLGEITGLQSGALSPHLKKLQEGGLVEKVAFENEEGDVRERYQVSPFGHRVLDQLLGAFRPTRSSSRVVRSRGYGAEEIEEDTRQEDRLAAASVGEVVVLEGGS